MGGIVEQLDGEIAVVFDVEDVDRARLLPQSPEALVAQPQNSAEQHPVHNDVRYKSDGLAEVTYLHFV